MVWVLFLLQKIILSEGFSNLSYYLQKVFLQYDKFPYGKPQTDEVARGSGTESMAVRD